MSHDPTATIDIGDDPFSLSSYVIYIRSSLSVSLCTYVCVYILIYILTYISINFFNKIRRLPG